MTVRDCVSSTFCIFSDAASIVMYDGHTFTRGTFAVAGTSCASTTFCIADVGGGQVRQFNGTSWSAPVPIDDPDVGFRLSCPTATFCVAIDSAERALYFNGTTWTAPSPAIGGDVGQLSCASATLCIATTFSTSVLRYNGVAWTSTVLDSGNQGVGWVSCAAGTKFCLAIDTFGNALTLNGKTWSDPTPANTPRLVLQNPTCVSAKFCMATGNAGYVQIAT
jgi:hypothetical protein